MSDSISEQQLKQHIRNANLEDMKARSRSRVIAKAAHSVEFILDLWLDPRESAELIAGVLATRAVNSSISLEQLQALVAHMYAENLKLKKSKAVENPVLALEP